MANGTKEKAMPKGGRKATKGRKPANANGTSNGKGFKANGLALLDDPGSPLNYRQRLFVYYYLGDAKGVAVKAAEMAGYAHPISNACRLMDNDGIRAALTQAVNEAGMSPVEQVARLAEQASGPPRECFNPRTGKPDLKRIYDSGLHHWIEGVTPTKQGPAVKFPSSQVALKLMAQISGLIRSDQHTHFHLPPDLSLYSDSQIAAMRRGEDPGPPALQGQPKTVGTEAAGSGQQGQLEPPGADSTIIETTGGEESQDGKPEGA
jgi:hypothetical protein